MNIQTTLIYNLILLILNILYMYIYISFNKNSPFNVFKLSFSGRSKNFRNNLESSIMRKNKKLILNGNTKQNSILLNGYLLSFILIFVQNVLF